MEICEIVGSVLILFLTGCLALMWVIIREYQRQAKMTVQKRCRRYAERTKVEQRKKGAEHFVKLYNANQRIKELEKELAKERLKNSVMVQATGFREVR